jgi:hypothetical protein
MIKKESSFRTRFPNTIRLPSIYLGGGDWEDIPLDPGKK